ncbi:MAG: hypothetical protein ABI968_01560 [Acidobacteriota bacterium]
MSRSQQPVRPLLLVSIVLALTPAVGTAQPTFGYSPRFCQIWNVAPSANLPSGDSSLGAIAAVTPNDMWAVGSSLDGSRHTLTEHWNGTAWSIVASPDGPQPTNFLMAVDALSTGDVWAVGFSASANPFDPQSKTVVEHWNGAGWGVVPSPNPPLPRGFESSNELFGVAAASPNDVWAVGHTYDFSDGQSLILHWDGVEWTDMSTPDPGLAGWLNGIEVVSPNDVWAVGWNSVDFVQVNLIKHWDGTSWSVVDAPNVGNFVNQLESVSASSPNDVWAVGFHLDVIGVDQPNQTSVLHWNGTAWSVVPSPNRTQLNNYLFDVVGLSAGNAWAVGFYDNGFQLLTMIQRWNGFEWGVVTSSNASDATNELTGIVAVGPNEAWAVGQSFGFFNWETLVEHLSCPSQATTRTVKR